VSARFQCDTRPFLQIILHPLPDVLLPDSSSPQIPAQKCARPLVVSKTSHFYPLAMGEMT
jgi:hypothetical protein